MRGARAVAADASPSVARLRAKLVTATRTRILARGSDGTRLRGEGDMVTSMGPESSLLLSESGVWRDERAGAIRFTNAYRWDFARDCVRLYRERNGAAVELVELVPRDGDRFASRRPHLCGEDCYEAAVRIAGDRIIVRWRVRGPRKLQCVRWTASTAGEAGDGTAGDEGSGDVGREQRAT